MSERLIGVVDSLASDHLWIDAQDGGRYVAHAKETKAPGDHLCLLLNQEVDFELFKYNGQTQARDVRLVDESVVELPEYEESTVFAWNGEFGFAIRNGCGCHVFLHKAVNKHVRSVGDVIRHKLVLDAVRNRWE